MSNDLTQNILKPSARWRGHQKKEVRYFCFCEKNYLSYPAFYLHLKRKHQEYFRNNQKIAPTEFEQQISPQGLRILKMVQNKQMINEDQKNLKSQSFETKIQENSLKSFPQSNPKTHQFLQLLKMSNKKSTQLQNQLLHEAFHNQCPGFGNVPKQQFKSNQNMKHEMIDSHLLQRSINKYENKFNIIDLLNQYFKEKYRTNNANGRQHKEIQIVFTLLIRTIRKSQDLLVQRLQIDKDKNICLIESKNLEYLKIFLPYFRKFWIRIYIQEVLTNYEDQQNSQFQLMLPILFRKSKYFSNFDKLQELLKQFQNWLVANRYLDQIEENFSKIC